MKTELEFQARVEFESKSRGASYLAYPPVVAAGITGGGGQPHNLEKNPCHILSCLLLQNRK